MSSPGHIPRFALACIFLTAALIPALDYGFGPGDETMIARREIHRGILNQTARTPDRYRWLAAGVIEAPTRVLATVMPYDRAYDRVSFVFYLAAITGMLWSLYAYLRVWFGDQPALIASLVAACTIRITMRQHDYAPYSYLEPTFVALALLLILHKRHVALGVLIAVATFNRETAVFLVTLYLFTSDFSQRAWVRTATYGAIWAAGYGLVRWVGGDAERYWTLERVWRTNMSQPQLAAYNIALLLGVFWLLALLGWRHAPSFVRRSALVAPFYLVTVALWGIWWEVRLLMPLYPMLFGFALAYLVERKWPAWALAGIFATVIATSASDYSVLVPQQQMRYQMHDAIVSGTAPAPQKYRLLVARTLDPVITVATRNGDREQAFRRVYFAFHVFALTALVAGVYAYARLWYSTEASLIGALIVASTLHLVLRMGEYWDFSPIPDRTWFAPWSLLEPVFVAAALIAIYKRTWLALGFVIALALANSAAAPLLAGLPPLTIEANLQHLPSTLINLGLFLGPAIVLAMRGFSDTPRFAQRALLAGVPLVIAVALFGYWWDVRLLTPLYPLLTPALLAGMFKPTPPVI